jgi:hypothetical protein
MSRISISDEEDYPGQFGLWEGNCDRQIRGKAGQAALRRLEAALLALPEKRLISHKLVDSEAQVCAIGALAKAEGKLPEPEPWGDDEYDEDDTAEFATDNLNVPRLVAWKVVYENDENNDYKYVTAEGPERNPYGYGHNRGILLRVEVTPEQRYERMLQWVQERIKR